MKTQENEKGINEVGPNKNKNENEVCDLRLQNLSPWPPFLQTNQREVPDPCSIS